MDGRMDGWLDGQTDGWNDNVQTVNTPPNTVCKVGCINRCYCSFLIRVAERG